ncbi:MAG: LPS-assembly protein LptD, partial [Bacteroidaceae bacterium]|nr:LPS-assembly protein LptD [Bacteroidaceae bacterium]
NSINTKENLLFKSDLIKDWKNAMRHQIPISASFSLFNYINITPNFNFTDRMYTNKVMQSWDNDAQQVRRDTVYGFYNVYDFNFSVSANTKLYGMYYPLPWFGGKRIPAIRHVFTPSVSFSYAPDFSSSTFGYYDTYVKTDEKGNVSTVNYSPFSGQQYGVPGKGMTGNVSLDISNNVEMKWRMKNDSIKKISLIDELGASLSYNMAAESRPWSDLNTRLRIKLGKSRTFSMNAVFATYAYEFDKNGNVVVGDRTEWSYGRFGRFQGMSHSISQTINPETLKKWFGKGKDKERQKNKVNPEDEEYDEEEDIDPEMQNVDPDRKKARTNQSDSKGSSIDEDGYLKFSIPWNFSISYSISMREDRTAKINESNMRYPYKLTHTLNFSGNVQIAKGWNINFSSGYDFNYNKLSMTTATITRKLHCFTMSCSLVLAPYSSYNFTFQADSSTLADLLKWKKQSSYSSNIEWY